MTNFAGKIGGMQLKVTAPNHICGQIVLPSSKSISNRALVINALAGSSQEPENVSDCDDTKVMLQWLKTLPYTVDIGAAGTAMRFSTALLSVSEGEHIIGKRLVPRADSFQHDRRGYRVSGRCGERSPAADHSSRQQHCGCPFETCFHWDSSCHTDRSYYSIAQHTGFVNETA